MATEGGGDGLGSAQLAGSHQTDESTRAVFLAGGDSCFWGCIRLELMLQLGLSAAVPHDRGRARCGHGPKKTWASRRLGLQEDLGFKKTWASRRLGHGERTGK